jgi:hypothetical protein
VLSTVAGGLVAAFFAAQVVLAIQPMQNAVALLLIAPNLSDTDKMYIRWGDVFAQLDFIRRETPPDAVILMKKDDRPEFDQYFLFPRRVIYGDAEALQSNPQVEYVLITDNYPQFPIDGVKILMDNAHGLYWLAR